MNREEEEKKRGTVVTEEGDRSEGMGGERKLRGREGRRKGIDKTCPWAWYRPGRQEFTSLLKCARPFFTHRDILRDVRIFDLVNGLFKLEDEKDLKPLH